MSVRLAAGCLRGGVVGPRNIVGAREAGHLGTGQIGWGLVSSKPSLTVTCAVRKKLVCSTVMRHVSRMAGDMIMRICD